MSHHVDVDAAAPDLVTGVGAAGHDNARVRAEEVDRTEPFLGRVDECAEPALVGHVTLDREDRSTVARLPGDGVERILLNVGDNDSPGAFGREPPRASAAPMPLAAPVTTTHLPSILMRSRFSSGLDPGSSGSCVSARHCGSDLGNREQVGSAAVGKRGRDLPSRGRFHERGGRRARSRQPGCEGPCRQRGLDRVPGLVSPRQAPVLVEPVLGGDPERAHVARGERRDEQGRSPDIERGVVEGDLVGEQSP